VDVVVSVIFLSSRIGDSGFDADALLCYKMQLWR